MSYSLSHFSITSSSSNKLLVLLVINVRFVINTFSLFLVGSNCRIHTSCVQTHSDQHVLDADHQKDQDRFLILKQLGVCYAC